MTIIYGDVGINTTTQSQTLQVLGTLNITSQETRNADLFVTSSGNVAIGKANASSTLNVFGNFSVESTTNASSNASIGFFTTGLFNASCVGFRFRVMGGY